MIVAETIRANEIDGATLLVLGEDEVVTLATSALDKKKLLGAFRELANDLGETRSVNDAGGSPEMRVAASPLRVSTRGWMDGVPSASPTSTERLPPVQGALPESPSSVSDDAEVRRLGLALSEAMEEVRLLLVSFLFDAENQANTVYGPQPLIFEAQAASAREPVSFYATFHSKRSCDGCARFSRTRPRKFWRKSRRWWQVLYRRRRQASSSSVVVVVVRRRHQSLLLSSSSSSSLVVVVSRRRRQASSSSGVVVVVSRRRRRRRRRRR